MGTKEETIKMRKRNMKIFPTYKALAWDYLFFYTIDFLFLTQIKHISASNVILKEAFYSIFGIVLQIPANIIIDFLGRRNSIIFGNILNCLYIVIVMLSGNLGDLIFAEFICALAFSIKNSAQPSLLGASIPPSRYKSKIYSKINSKGSSRYYLLNALSKVMAGYLFTINGYLPIGCSLVVVIISTISSLFFIEPVHKIKLKTEKAIVKQQLKQTKNGFIYSIKSNRVKALILCGALIVAAINIWNTYNVSLFEDLKISSIAIGIISAIGSLLSAYSSKMQEKFHQMRRNKSLMTLANLISISFIIAGIAGIISEKYAVFVTIIIMANCIIKACEGLYHNLMDKYISNFANKHIDTKIFSTQLMFTNLMKAMFGVLASFLISKMTTAVCMIVVGWVFVILFILVGRYMKTRVGLKPEEYSKEERRYDELKTN